MAFIGNSSTVIVAGGGDYTSLQAWETAVSGDFVTATAGEKAVCSGSTADSKVIISGATTSATYYWYITCEEDHGGKWNSSNFHIDAGGTSCLTGNDNNIRIENIQFNQDTYTFQEGIALAGSASTGRYLIERCIIKQTNGTATSPASAIEIGWNAASGSGDFPQGFAASNNIIYDFYYGIHTTTSRTRYSNNNTVYGSVSHGYYAASGTLICKNCISQANSGSDFSGTMTGSDYNADEDGTATGANSQTGTVSFTDTSTDDYHLQDSDTVALDLGTDLSADTYPVTVDNENTARTGTWDIGAHQQTAAAAGGRRIFVVS